MGNINPRNIIGVKAVLQFNHLQGLQSGNMTKIPEVEVAQLPTGPQLAVGVSEAASMKAQKSLPRLDVSTSHQLLPNLWLE